MAGILAVLAARPPAAAAAAIEVGKTVPVRTDIGNRAVSMTIRNAALVDHYGDTKAKDGQLFLVLSTQWENILPVKLTNENKSIPTGYKIPDLAEHAYVVVDGVRVCRLSPETSKLPGHLKTKDFNLSALGDIAKGNLVFEVPKALASAAATFDFYYFDLSHGHFHTLLAGTAPQPTKPLSSPRQNRVVQAGAYGIRKSAELGGQKAPPGMTYVSVDLRAESTYTAEADASAFDPKQRPGTKTQKAIFADWNEWRKYTYLIVNHEWAYAVEPKLTDLPEAPRLLPEVPTGGTVVFLAPAETKSLELRLDFPNARSGAQVFRPTGFTLHLEGRSVNLPENQSVLQIEDDFFKVAVTGQKVVEEYAGVKAKDGKLVVLDLEVMNSGRQGEFFQVKEQLKLVTEQATSLEISDATFAGVYRPTPLVWIPPSERRSFTIVFEAPATLAKPRLAYAGVTMAKVFDLPGIGGGAVAASQPTEAGQGSVPSTGPAVAMTPPVKPLNSNTTGKKKDLLPARVKAKQPTKPMGLAAANLTQEQVNASIDRGAVYLWAYMAKEIEKIKKGDVRFSGYHGLYLLALVHADHHKKNPACEAGVRYFLSDSDPLGLGIYASGVYLMLAESFGDAMYMPKVEKTTRYLIESQGKAGTWGYHGNTASSLYEEPPPDLSQPLTILGGRPLEGPGSDQAVMTRKSKMEAGEDGDNSSTQYAILGLHSAARMGLKVPVELWKRTYEETVRRQWEDGGFGYVTDRSYGSMTCAGVGTLTLCRHHMGEKEPAADEVIERGIGWLDVKFSVTENPNSGESWLYYYLYGMERVGRILDTEYIGDNEWYPFGAKMLLSRQESDGSWVHTGSETDPPLPTSFALLFLTRATPNLTIAKREGPGIIKTEMVTPPMNRLYIIMDASGSMLEEMGGRQKFQIAQDAVVSLIETLPANSEVALRVYGHRKRALDKEADLDTQLLVPMAKLDKAKLTATVRALRCRGKTPLATSLKEAAEDLAGTTDRAMPTTLVLLTDGGEDTMPRQDPVKAAAEIAKLTGLSFQVVGFDINRQDWSDQLLNTARAGKGQYLPAAKAEVLLDRLNAAIFRTPEQWVVHDAAGKEVGRGLFGQQVKLPAGKYMVTTSLAGMKFTREAWVNPQSTTVARFDSVRVDFSKAPAQLPTPANAPPVQAGAPPVTNPPAVPAPPAANRPKFCTSCGKPLAATGKFCTNCGKPVAQ
jgi:hypothetical protein